jgi:cytochrome d ubiquinol oxidase subunit II
VTFRVQPQVTLNLTERPWGLVFPLIALAGLGGMRVFFARADDRKGFLASCAFIVGMLTSVVFGLYPLVLPATDVARSLTVHNAKAADYGLRIGLIWWSIGMVLCTGYFVFLYRHFAGKVRLDSNHEGY